MSLLDELGRIVTYPGALISGALDHAQRGVVVTDTVHVADGNAFHIVADLRDDGIDAFAPVPLSGSLADVSVRRGDKRRALEALRRRGYECW